MFAISLGVGQRNLAHGRAVDPVIILPNGRLENQVIHFLLRVDAVEVDLPQFVLSEHIEEGQVVALRGLHFQR